MVGITVVVEPFLFVSTSRTLRGGACRAAARLRTGARARMFLVHVMFFLASQALVGLLVALARLVTTATILATMMVTAIVVTVTWIPTIVMAIISRTVITSGTLATTTIVFVSGLGGRRFLLLVLFFLLDLLEGPSTNVDCQTDAWRRSTMFVLTMGSMNVKKNLGVGSLVRNDTANHVFLAVGILDRCRVLHLDLVRLLEH
jgi:hypothetical protein